MHSPPKAPVHFLYFKINCISYRIHQFFSPKYIYVAISSRCACYIVRTTPEIATETCMSASIVLSMHSAAGLGLSVSKWNRTCTERRAISLISTPSLTAVAGVVWCAASITATDLKATLYAPLPWSMLGAAAGRPAGACSTQRAEQLPRRASDHARVRKGPATERWYPLPASTGTTLN
jgi:hypothetical protein